MRWPSSKSIRTGGLLSRIPFPFTIPGCPIPYGSEGWDIVTIHAKGLLRLHATGQALHSAQLAEDVARFLCGDYLLNKIVMVPEALERSESNMPFDTMTSPSGHLVWKPGMCLPSNPVHR